MMNWLRIICFALGLCFLWGCEPGENVEQRVLEAKNRNDAPPIWVVKDVDSTLYLFGTVHLLPADLSWQKEDMRDVFRSAGTVFFEIDTRPAAQLEASIVLSERGFYTDGQLLSERLDDYQLKLLTAATNNGALSFDRVDSMKPWLASEFLILGAAASAGLDPDVSADAALKSMAQTQRKNILYLDSAENQMRRSDTQADFVQMNVLNDTLTRFNDIGDTLDQTIKAWVSGDVQTLEREIIASMQIRSPDMYAALFSDPNQEWGLQLTRFMEGSGTGFAAIGVGHLLGEDSLQNYLKEQGYTVHRYFAFQGENVIRPIFETPSGG